MQESIWDGIYPRIAAVRCVRVDFALARMLSQAELRVAYRLCTLELGTGSPSRGASHGTALKILGQPELHTCHDLLLADGEVPAISYRALAHCAWVTSVHATDKPFRQSHPGVLARAKLPQFHLPRRQRDFYEDRALCRDVRRRFEFQLDRALLHFHWDHTCNQWKCLDQDQGE